VCIIAHAGNGADVAADLVNNPASWIETVWVRIGEEGGGYSDAAPSWTAGIANCESLDYAGYADWRMPNLKELISIVDYSAQSPAINTTFFPTPGISIPYHTSTTLCWSTSYAWGVNFTRGYVADTGVDKSTLGAVLIWPVRGGI
jgi:hypothetical protein